MSVCACGRITRDGQVACDRCAALVLFGLTRSAKQPEIKDAYRVLAKVWHPDRFCGDDGLRAKAEKKLKEINSAYQLLRTTAPDDVCNEPARPGRRSDENHRSAATASSDGPYGQHSSGPVTTPYQAARRSNKKPLAIAVAVLLLGGGVWMAVRYVPRAAWSFGSAARDRAASGSPEAKSGKRAVQPETIGQIRTDTPVTNDSSRSPEKNAARAHTNTASSDRASLIVYPAEDPQVPYFTVGSTRNDVMRVQGAPDKVAGNVFEYGLSKVYFENGRVESWHADPGSPLKARMP